MQDLTTWNLAKLVSLLRELNDNYGRKNQYASHGLLRTVLNHVPPIFDQETFSQVVASHRGQTDKKYLRTLETFRAQGDDALHRPIRKTRDLIEMDDLPPRAAVNALVRIVIDAVADGSVARVVSGKEEGSGEVQAP